LRAVYVPVIHDEIVSWQLYIKSGLYLPFDGYVDANNHVLNSFLGFIASKLFPETAFTIRLANILSLPLYLYFAFKISKLLISKHLQCTLFVVLCSSDFVIEFFGIGRGYGLSQAFLLGTLFYGLRYIQKNEVRYLIRCFFTVFLMLWSNLSMLNLALVFLAYLAFLFLSDKRNTLKNKLLISIGVLFLIIPTSIHALFLKEQGNLYLGEGGSFESNVIHSLGNLIFNLKDVESSIAFGFVCLLLFSLGALQLTKQFSFSFLLRNPSFFLLYLFAANIFLILAQYHLLGVNYPLNRAALSVWFTLIIAFFFSLDAQKVLPQAKYIAILFLILPIQFLTKINLSYTKLWDYELISPSFYEIIEKANPSATIGGKNVQKHVWNFESRKQNTNINSLQIYSTENASNFDFILIRNDSNLVIPSNFSLLECNSISDLCLFQNQKPATRTYLFDSTISHHFNEDEFIPLWVPVPDSFSGNGVYVEVDGFFKTEYSSSNLAFVVSKTNTNGDVNYYNALELVCISNKLHKGEKLKTGLILPRLKPAENARIYLWNSSRHKVELNQIQIRFYSVFTEV
jgi:hypothetical protein